MQFDWIAILIAFFTWAMAQPWLADFFKLFVP